MDAMVGFWWELKEVQTWDKKTENPQDIMEDWDALILGMGWR